MQTYVKNDNLKNEFSNKIMNKPQKYFAICHLNKKGKVLFIKKYGRSRGILSFFQT